MNYEELALPMTVAEKGRPQRTKGAISSLSPSSKAGEDQCPSSETVRKRECAPPAQPCVQISVPSTDWTWPTHFRADDARPSLLIQMPVSVQKHSPRQTLMSDPIFGASMAQPTGHINSTLTRTGPQCWEEECPADSWSWRSSHPGTRQPGHPQPSGPAPASLWLPRLRAFLNRPLGPVGSFSRSPSGISEQSCPVLLFAVNKLDYEEQRPSS